CQGDFATSDDCAEGHFCAGGVCSPRRPLGETCGSTDECESGHCVDGLCCDRACDGQCEACDGAGSLGLCAPIAGAPHGGRAPCDGTGTCGGVCDGTDALACRYPGADTTCREPTCSADIAKSEAACNGSGMCSSPTSVHCEAGC